MSIRLGPISLDFEGSHSVRDLVEAELGHPDPQAGQSLTISVETDPPGTIGARIDGSRLMLRHSVAERDGGLRFTMGLKHASTLYTVDVGIDLLHGDAAHVTVYLPRHLDGWSHLSAPFARMLSRDTSSLLEIAAKNTIYELIDGIAEYRLLRADASFLHSSAVTASNGTVVIAGTGGVGKSTSLLAAMARYPELSYMGDDLVVVQSNGTVFRHPKRIQIYRYNLESDPGLQRRLLARLSPWRRMVWKTRAALLGPKQARIRIRAEDMFGRSRVADEAVLRAVIWANPSSGEGVTVRSIEPAEAARRCGVALIDELWDICRFMSLGSVLSPAGMAIGEFFDRVVDVYESAFAAVPVVEMLVPERSNPEMLAREIARITLD